MAGKALPGYREAGGEAFGHKAGGAPGGAL